MKLVIRRRSSMVGRQEMRKGNQMKIKMLDIKIKMSDMRIKQMPDMRIKQMPNMMPDMRINIPDIRIQAGCGTLMFKNCLSRSHETLEVQLERKPRLRNSRKTRLRSCMKDATTGMPA